MKSTMKTLGNTLLVAALSFGVPLTSFAYEAQPFANTYAPSYITQQSAQLNGFVTPSQLPDTQQWFEWGLSGRPNTVYETTHLPIYGSDQSIQTSAQIFGLAPSTQYFFRAVAENSRGKNIGQTTYFTTKALQSTNDPIALITTLPAKYITESTVTLTGYMSPHGSYRSSYWFEWGTSVQFENRTSPVNAGGSSIYVERTLSQLMPDTTYYYRAVAESGDGQYEGELKVFHTLGTKAVAEVANGEQITLTKNTTGAVAQKETTTGNNPIAQTSVDGNGLPSFWSSSQNRPGDFLGAFLQKLKAQKDAKAASTTSTNTTTPAANTTTKTSGTVAATDQAASVTLASNNPFSAFWNSLTGKKTVGVTVERVGPVEPAAHTAVEYRVSYNYDLTAPASNAFLSIALPKEVIYIGDNTNNELLVQDVASVSRTYVLPIGRLAKGQSRTFSVLGMTTGDVQGFPFATAKLEYDKADGTHVAVTEQVAGAGASGDASAANSASVSESGSWSILPSSILGWILYVLVLLAIFFGYRKTKEYFIKRKALLEAEKQEAAENEPFSLSQLPQ